MLVQADVAGTAQDLKYCIVSVGGSFEDEKQCADGFERVAKGPDGRGMTHNTSGYLQSQPVQAHGQCDVINQRFL